MSEHYVVETEEYKGYTINILPDIDPPDPIENFDMMGKMIFFHDRYNLGHKHEEEYEHDPEEFMEWLKINKGEVLSLPVYMYEHSGITIHAGGKPYPYNDPWDSGMIGYIYVTYETIRKEYSCKRVTKKILERAEGVLLAEIKEYDQFLQGDVYGYEILDPNGEYVDSLWGFYGEYPLDEAKSTIDYVVKESLDKANKTLAAIPVGAE